MKKLLLVSIVFFVVGFFTHALLFPDLFANGIVFIPEVTKNQTTDATPTAFEIKPLITIVTFDGEKFSRHNIKVGKTRYVSIVNKGNDALMSLVSSEKTLTTPRPYAFEEEVNAQMNKTGEFVVALKDNPAERLVITVK